MKAIAINGSPRRKWNTATLLENALNGCRATGAETEMVHLYSHAYQGCTSCFSCKKIGGKSYGRCAMRDELSPILDRALQADVLILGSPLYFHNQFKDYSKYVSTAWDPEAKARRHKEVFPQDCERAYALGARLAAAA
jgi:multimeric flavodoxin WrbA